MTTSFLEAPNFRFRIVASQSAAVTPTHTASEALTEMAKFISPILDAEYAYNIEGIKIYKNSSKSIMFRNEGNNAYGQKQFMKSLLSYDDSISHAPINSEELALAYANRSAVLREMGKLTECIADLQRALDCGYRETLKYKLLLREAQCLRDLGQSKQAHHTFSLALKALELSELSDDIKLSVRSTIVEEKKKKFCKVTQTHNVITPTEVPPLSYGPSQEVPCASSALGLRYDDTFGRHFVATTDIKIGDVLVVENAICVKPASSSPEDIHSCSHCYKICFTLLPCPNCTWAMFCSSECMNAADEQYHLVECPVTSKLLLLDKELVLSPAIRCIAKVGVENVEKYVKTDGVDTNEAKRTRGFNSQGIYDSSDMLTAFNLESNFSQNTLEGKLHLCVIALEMAKCFNPSTYLKSNEFTTSLLHLFASFRCNNIGIKYPSFSSTNDYNVNGVGNAIFPVMSLLSHSCNPNSIPAFNGTKIVLRALYPISKGTQVTQPYIIPWEQNNKISRQKKLKATYTFDCKCEACLNDWPTVHSLQHISDYDLNKIPAKYDIGNKLSKLQEESPKVVPQCVKLLLKNKKLYINYVENTIKNISEVISVLHNQNQVVNRDFVAFKMQLSFLLTSCSTTIVSMD